MQHTVTTPVVEPQDAYADAVAYLTDAVASMPPHDRSAFLMEVWTDPYIEYGGCLFAYTGVGGGDKDNPTSQKSGICGCLTQVKGWSPPSMGEPSIYFGPSDTALLDRIKADPQIPAAPNDLTVENLPAFAFYQREIDRILGRPPLRWDHSLDEYSRGPSPAPTTE